MIKAWSMSRLDVYESCPYRAYLQYVEKIPQAELVIPEGKLEHPLIKGRRVHDAAEAYVTKDVLLIEELQHFQTDFEDARAKFRETPHQCVVEQEWAVDRAWQSVGWNSATTWGRLKLDYAFRDESEMQIVDYKTGKKYPAKHVQQGQLYAVVSFEKYPEIEKIETEFWYLDSGDRLSKSYSRIQARVLRDDFEQRAHAMTTAVDFPPKSSSWNCRFCPYGEGADGNKHCEYRYSF